jgi:hypothetical protein
MHLWPRAMTVGCPGVYQRGPGAASGDDLGDIIENVTRVFPRPA